MAYSVQQEVVPKARHFETQSVFFNAINAVTYESDIRCANKHGPSPRAAPLTVTPVGPPEKPQKTWVVDTEEDSIILAWERPFSDGGSPVTKYHIRSIAIGRRGANCEKQCSQQFNENQPPPDYTKMRPEHWNQYFAGDLQKTPEEEKVDDYLNGEISFEESIAEPEAARSETEGFMSDLQAIEEVQVEEVTTSLNDTIGTGPEGTDQVDLKGLLNDLVNNTNVKCVHIGFGSFTQPDAFPNTRVCDPFCRLIQQPGKLWYICIYTVASCSVVLCFQSLHVYIT